MPHERTLLQHQHIVRQHDEPNILTKPPFSLLTGVGEQLHPQHQSYSGPNRYADEPPYGGGGGGGGMPQNGPRSLQDNYNSDR